LQTGINTALSAGKPIFGGGGIKLQGGFDCAF